MLDGQRFSCYTRRTLPSVFPTLVTNRGKPTAGRMPPSYRPFAGRTYAFKTPTRASFCMFGTNVLHSTSNRVCRTTRAVNTFGVCECRFFRLGTGRSGVIWLREARGICRVAFFCLPGCHFRGIIEGSSVPCQCARAPRVGKSGNRSTSGDDDVSPCARNCRRACPGTIPFASRLGVMAFAAT